MATGVGGGEESQETKVLQQEKKKVAGKMCRAWTQFLELQVAGEQGGNAFSVCAGRAERI